MIPVIFGGLAGGAIFGSATVSRFEREAAAELKSTLQGEHREVSVRARVGIESLFGNVPGITIEAAHFQSQTLPFHAEPSRSRRGILPRLRLEMSDFTLAGLQIESLDAVIRHNRFDMALALAHHEFRLSRSGTGEATVRIRQERFEPFILAKYKEVRTVVVKMQSGMAHISGFAQLGFVAAQFQIDSRLGTREGTQLVFLDPQVSLGGKKPDPKLAQLLIGIFSPILDLDKDLHLEHAVIVNSVELENGYLIGHGTVTIPNKT